MLDGIRVGEFASDGRGVMNLPLCDFIFLLSYFLCVMISPYDLRL